MPELTPEEAMALLTQPRKPPPVKKAKPIRRHPFEPGRNPNECRRCRKPMEDGGVHYNGNTVDTRKYGVNAPF